MTNPFRPRNLPRPSGAVMGPPQQHQQSASTKQRNAALGLDKLRELLPSLNRGRTLAGLFPGKKLTRN